MRMFDFECPQCGHHFEELVRCADDGAELVCPECGHQGVERLMSGFSVGGGGGKSGGGVSAGCGSGGFT